MPYDLLRLVPAHRAIVAQIREMFPDESDDDLADTVAGESNLPDAIIAVLRIAIDREAYAKALGELIDGMATRKRRLHEGAQSLRAAALQAIQESGLPTPLRAPDMSVSVGRGKAKIIIRDETEIPVHLCRSTVEPNKILIAAAIAAGDDVPGVTLGNPQPVLTIHRS